MEHRYFYEDSVFRVGGGRGVWFGLVLDNCDASSRSSSDADDALQRGELRVLWHPSGREQVLAEAKVGLADRALMPGDVVRRMIKGKDTQRGYCRDIIVTGAVQVVGTNLVLPAVPSERLQPLEEFTSDLAVCLDSWVGTSKIVHSKLRLMSSDGSKLEFPDVNLCLLEDSVQRRRRRGRGSGSEHHAANEFYPGQTVVGPSVALDHAVWHHTTKEMEAAKKHKMRELKFTIECVETESVGVHWQCRALGEQSGGGPPQQPRFLVEGDDLKRLKLLNLFEPCTLQVGAKNFLTLTAEDTFSSKNQWKKTQSKIYKSLRKRTKSPSTKPKESPLKDLNNAACAQPQDPNFASVHTFKLPVKSKKRMFGYTRDGRPVCYNHHQNLLHDNKKESSSDGSSKTEQCEQSKMDVDIVIMDDDKSDSAACADVKKDPLLNKTIEKISSARSTISPQRSDEGAHLDIPDVSCNGKCTSSDRSCSPDVELRERHKKFRKSRVTSTNNSRSASPAVFNPDSKSAEAHMKLNDSDSWENSSSDECTDTDSCATWSSQCSSSTNSLASGRGKKSPHLVTKFFKGKRLKRTARRNSSTPQPKPGDRVVVETLCTKSKANVVWQDGTIELNIPSTELYPIHHLDGQECFPGDFVISGVTGEAAPSHRDYGVVQKVDHYGRTAVVKWFRTYTSCQEPIPQFMSESEVSVYDLKDHPDFQYRPGTVVIRVANFTGTETSCTAGQVMDNFPSGRVNVWWVDGHTSMCWPQDLYKVGEYDSEYEEGELWEGDGSSSEDSWETQSSGADSGPDKNVNKENDQTENAALPDAEDLSVKAVLNSISAELPKVPRTLEPRAAAHIEKGLNGMARLEEILSQNPSLQSHEIMRKLLTLYKDCRFLDRLMGTSYFHEDHFQGLLERVRERGANRESGSSNAGVRRVHNQVMRLFSRDDLDGPDLSTSAIADKSSKGDSNTTLTSTQNSNINKYTISDINQKIAMNIPIIPQLEVNSSIFKTDLVSSQYQSEVSDSFINANVSDETNILSTDDTNGNSNLKGPSIDINSSSPNDDESFKNNTLSPQSTTNVVNKCSTLSPLSDGSLSKYGTPSGSMGDLTNQNDRSPNSGIDRNKNEDSGIDSQSLSISHSANNTATSSNLESSITTGEDSAILPETETFAEARKDPSVSGTSSTTQISNRNVCQKLCSLIAKQLLMACSEINRQFDTVIVSVDETTESSTTKVDVNDEDKPKIETDIINTTTEETTEGPPASVSLLTEFGEGFTVMEIAPNAHRFRLSLLSPSEPRVFHQAVNREIKLLKSDLPPGVWVRGYEDRMDLLSIMIAGPAKTPYEDGLFLFDVQLGGEYPRAPPLCHYISYCSDRLNPNLYEDGKVCVSLLGTWSGRGVEVWGRDSSLLQVIVSLQGLILCAEPYFNEAGFDKQKGSQQGSENSRMYNEMVLLKLVQSLTKMVLHPPEIFKNEIFTFQSRHASSLCDRLRCWMVLSESHNSQNPESPLAPDSILKDASECGLQPPEYPLIPASRGFCLSLRSSLESYCNALTKVGISFEKKL